MDADELWFCRSRHPGAALRLDFADEQSVVQTVFATTTLIIAIPTATHLFICTGDQARQNPDFLAVVNFDETSADYGKVIARAPLPEPGARRPLASRRTISV